MRLFVLACSLVCWFSCQPLLAQEEDDPTAGEAVVNPDTGETDSSPVETDSPSETAGDGHAGGGHDDPNATNPFVIDPDLAICTGIVFVLLVLVLSKYAWGPIVEALDNREQSVANKIDEANKNFTKAQEQLAIYEKKIAAAAEESRAMVETARKDAEAVAGKIRVEAEEDAKRQRDRAVADIEAAKNAALRDISEKSADIAVSLAGKIVRREVKSADHAELIRGALDKMPSSN